MRGARDAIEAVGTRWLALAQGDREWTAFARLAVWLCVPALIAGAAGAISQIGGVTLSPMSPHAEAIARAASFAAVLFGMAAMFLTPIAAALVLVLSLLRRWRIQVVGVLWFVVLGAMAIIFPAMETAMGNWMLLQGLQRGRQ